MDILVLRLSSMGDVILTAPLFSFLCGKYPSVSLTFITRADYAHLFDDDPRLIETIGISLSSMELPPRIREKKWDLIIDLQNSKRSHRLLDQIIHASDRKHFDKLHWQRLALLVLRWDRYPSQTQVALRYIDASGDQQSALSDSPPLRLYFNEHECRRAGQSLIGRTGGIERPALALFPFSAWKNKEWPGINYIAVGRYFHKKGWNIAVFGGPGDRTRAEEMSRRIGQRCISFAGMLSLYECGVNLTNFSLALGNDTGLSHLARADGVKTAVIFGPTTKHFGFFPYGTPPFRILEAPVACRPCHPHGGNFCYRFTRPCMGRIGVEKAIAELEGLSME